MTDLTTLLIITAAFGFLLAVLIVIEACVHRVSPQEKRIRGLSSLAYPAEEWPTIAARRGGGRRTVYALGYGLGSGQPPETRDHQQAALDLQRLADAGILMELRERDRKRRAQYGRTR